MKRPSGYPVPFESHSRAASRNEFQVMTMAACLIDRRSTGEAARRAAKEGIMAGKMGMTGVPRGIIQCPITPFTAANEVDLDLFGRVVEFLMKQRCEALCINLHLGESLNLTLDE